MRTAALQLDYVHRDALAGKPASWWDGVLGVVGFDSAPRIGVSVPVTASMTPSLGSSACMCEVWRVAHPARRTTPCGTSLGEGRVQYRFCDDLLFGSITLGEKDFEGNPSEALKHATATAYAEIFAVLKRTQHPHLFRMWNYLPDINADADGDERYRHFNSARRTAFADSGRHVVGTVPAASALGSPPGSPISIYFLASREPQTMIENPRQTSAYHYPVKYGIDSPSFSRACVLIDAGGTTLFVSGTASIVGCETIHHGDVTAQTMETLANIDALLDEANRVVGTSRYSLGALKYKVYVRKPEDWSPVHGVLSGSLPRSTQIVYLQADVCREDLLVEIEATGEALQ